MLQIIDNIISNFQDNFDISFIISVNVLTYIIINIFEDTSKGFKLTTWWKRLITICSAIILYMLYDSNGYNNTIVLINSSIIAPVSWSWILKPIVKLLKLDYKKIINSKKD